MKRRPINVTKNDDPGKVITTEKKEDEEAQSGEVEVLRNPDVVLEILNKASVEAIPSAIYVILLQSKEILKRYNDATSFWIKLLYILVDKIGLVRRRFVSTKEYQTFWQSYLFSVRKQRLTKTKRSVENIFWKLLVEYVTRYAIDTDLGMQRRFQYKMIRTDPDVEIIGDYNKLWVGTQPEIIHKTKKNLSTEFQYKYGDDKNDTNLSVLLKKNSKKYVTRSLWRQDGDYVIFEEIYNVAFETFFDDDKIKNKRLKIDSAYKPVIRVWTVATTGGELSLKSSFFGSRVQTEKAGYLFRDYFPLPNEKVLNFTFDGPSRSVRCYHLTIKKKEEEEEENISTTFFEQIEIEEKYKNVFKRGRIHISSEAVCGHIKYPDDMIFNRYKMLNARSLNGLFWVLCLEDSYGFENVTFDERADNFNFSAMDAVVLTYDYEKFLFNFTTLGILLEKYISEMNEINEMSEKFYTEYVKYVKNFKVMNYDVCLEEVSPNETWIILKTVEGVGTCPFRIRIRVIRTPSQGLILRLKDLTFIQIPYFEMWWLHSQKDEHMERHFLSKKEAKTVNQNPNIIRRNPEEFLWWEGIKKRVVNTSEVCLDMYDKWKIKDFKKIGTEEEEEGEELPPNDAMYVAYLFNFTNILSESISIYKFFLLRFDILTNITGMMLDTSECFTRTYTNYTIGWKQKYFQKESQNDNSVEYLDYLKETQMIWYSETLTRYIEKDDVSNFFMPRTSKNVIVRTCKPLTFIASLTNENLFRKNLIPGVDSIIQRNGLAVGAFTKKDTMFNQENLAYNTIGTFSQLIRMEISMSTWNRGKFFLWKEFSSSWHFEFPQMSRKSIEMKLNGDSGTRNVLDGAHLLFLGRLLVLVDPGMTTYLVVHDITKMRPPIDYYTYLTSNKIQPEMNYKN